MKCDIGSKSATLLYSNKNDLNQFYQRNYFDQLGKSAQIITKPVQHIQFISYGLKMSHDDLLNLGLRIINLDENKLG